MDISYSKEAQRAFNSSPKVIQHYANSLLASYAQYANRHSLPGKSTLSNISKTARSLLNLPPGTVIFVRKEKSVPRGTNPAPRIGTAHPKPKYTKVIIHPNRYYEQMHGITVWHLSGNWSDDAILKKVKKLYYSVDSVKAFFGGIERTIIAGLHTDLHDVTPYIGNPAERIGTAHPRRRSAATHAAPSKRLVRRRKANVKKGYFPNPIDLHAEFLIMLHLALARFKKAKTHQQAHVSYLQGLIDGGTGTHILTSSEATDWYQQIQSGVNKK